MSIQSELKKIEAEESVLIDLYTRRALPKDGFSRRHQPLSERRTQLENELPRLQAQCDVIRIRHALKDRSPY